MSYIVINTRPSEQAIELNQLLDQQQINYYNLPVIKISQKDLSKNGLAFLNNTTIKWKNYYHIFISQNAVLFAKKYFYQHLLPAKAIAVGKKTKQSLAPFPFRVLSAKSPFNSEKLLQMDAIQSNNNFIIWCGEKGRKKIAKELIKCGKNVQELIVYQQSSISADITGLQDRSQSFIVTVTSIAIAQELQKYPIFQQNNFQFVCLSQRIAHKIQKLGFNNNIKICSQADNLAIIKEIIQGF